VSCRVEGVVERSSSGSRTALERAGGSTTGLRRRALLLMPHEAGRDPRIDWIADGLSHNFDICEFGIRPSNAEVQGPSLQIISPAWRRVQVERTVHDWDWLPRLGDVAKPSSVAARQLALLCVYSQLPSKALSHTIGAFDEDGVALYRFRDLCRYMIDTNGALFQAARLTGQFDVIVAADLETLLAALLLSEDGGGTVVYDAHEYWPYSFPDFLPWEIAFWSELERSLVKEPAIRVTISPPMAARLGEEYGCDFIAVPNCAPLRQAVSGEARKPSRRRAGQEFVFLYQGLFAPGRGIEQLIHAWTHVEAPARLVLRGPDNAFKTKMQELVDSLGLGGGVIFPEPVSEDRLVAAATEADVGIIPYESESLNNRLSCPNKFSQYLAAGLPVISNDLEFIKETVRTNDIGAVVDFEDSKRLAATIERFCCRDALDRLSLRAGAFFKTEFHWEKVSRKLFDKIEEVVEATAAVEKPSNDFSWVESDQAMRTSAESWASAEITRLNREYPREIERLNRVYTEEIARLRTEMAIGRQLRLRTRLWLVGSMASLAAALRQVKGRIRSCGRPN
jgi:glycosyltransferase involved in cell wall biosynthesis